MTSKKKKELNSFPYLLLTHVTCFLKSKRKEKLKQDEVIHIEAEFTEVFFKGSEPFISLEFNWRDSRGNLR